MNQLFLKDFDSDEEDEEYIPDKKDLEEVDKLLTRNLYKYKVL